MVAIGIRELLVEVWVRSLQGSRVHGETDEDASDTRFHNFHGEHGHNESNDESNNSQTNPVFRHPGVSNNTSGQGGNSSSKDGSEHQDVADEVVVDDGLNSVGFDELPGVLSSFTVGLAIDGNLSEGVHVEVSDQRFKAGHDASQEASQEVVVLASSSFSDSLQGLEESNNQRTKANRSKGGCASSLESTKGWVVGHASGLEKVPRSVSSSNSDVDNVLDDLAGPVEGEQQEEENDSSGGEGLGKGNSCNPEEEPTNEQKEGSVGSVGGGWVIFNNARDSLEHGRSKWNSVSPEIKAQSIKTSNNEADNSHKNLSSSKGDKTKCDPESNVSNESSINELLGKLLNNSQISKRKENSNTRTDQYDGEQRCECISIFERNKINVVIFVVLSLIFVVGIATDEQTNNASQMQVKKNCEW